MIKAKIYKPTKNAMQSGRGREGQWILEYQSRGARSPEALMGWTSAEDTLAQVRLQFDTLDDAKSYAEKEGLMCVVSTPNERKIKPRNYGDNFKYEPPPQAATPKKIQKKSKK